MGTGVSVYFDGSILFAINNSSVDGHVVHAAPAGNSFVPVITSLIAGAASVVAAPIAKLPGTAIDDIGSCIAVCNVCGMLIRDASIVGNCICGICMFVGNCGGFIVGNCICGNCMLVGSVGRLTFGKLMFGRFTVGKLIVGNDVDSDDIPPDIPLAMLPPVETIVPPTPCKIGRASCRERVCLYV